MGLFAHETNGKTEKNSFFCDFESNMANFDEKKSIFHLNIDLDFDPFSDWRHSPKMASV